MGRSFGILMAAIVLGVGAYLYVKQAQSVTPGGTMSPKAAVDLTGVKGDLLSIAQAERSHNAQHGNYVSIEELQSGGDLAMTRKGRGPYTYAAEISGDGFRITATYSGPDAGMPKTISVDQLMQFTQE